MWNAGRRSISSLDDLRRLYVLAVRDCAKALPFKEVQRKAQSAWSSSSLPSFAICAAKLNDIYESAGYEASKKAARVAARFENGSEYGMQARVLSILSFVAVAQPQSLANMLDRLEKSLQRIEARGEDVAREVEGFHLIYSEGAVMLTINCVHKDTTIIMGNGKDIWNMLASLQDDVDVDGKTRALAKKLLMQFEGQKRMLDMDAAQNSMHSELDRPVGDILESLRKPKGGGSDA